MQTKRGSWKENEAGSKKWPEALKKSSAFLDPGGSLKKRLPKTVISCKEYC